MHLIKTRYTEKTGIQIATVISKQWQHVDTNDGALRCVGPVYGSKAQLMEDHTDYLIRGGWLKLAIRLPEPVLEVAVGFGCYAWAMEDVEVRIKVYGNTKAEAIKIFRAAIADEFFGRVTIEDQTQLALV